jgi:4-alpha-glucanotransferase
MASTLMVPKQRLSGVLLPVFSLRSHSDFGVGDFGAAEGLFDWLAAAGQSLWMMLPLLPTTAGDPSPYATSGASGLNPLFIHLDWLPEYQEAGGLRILSAKQTQALAEARSARCIRYDLVFELKRAALQAAFTHGEAHASERTWAFERFWAQEIGWLDDHALFTALAEEQHRRPWWDWPEELALRRPEALASARARLAPRVRFHAWLQWVAHEQWARVRASAKKRAIQLCGDEPFIVGQDSVDCWASAAFLRRDARLGVPPDAFSATGQDWGLPWFDFPAMEQKDWKWLRSRAEQSAAYYDLRRVDHAVGYFRQWIRDQTTPTGRFVPPDEPAQAALGETLFQILATGAGILAEDLGVIPPFVRQTLERQGIPGYRVLRWERDGTVFRDPSTFPAVSLATTGTHDTETLRAWWETTSDAERQAVAGAYAAFAALRPPPATFTELVHEALLETAERSASALCVVPWQDVFGLPDRINLPGTVQDANWSYRMAQPVEELLAHPETGAAAARLRQLTERGGRLPA